MWISEIEPGDALEATQSIVSEFIGKAACPDWFAQMMRVVVERRVHFDLLE
jgi:hypothetical protein